MAALALIAGCGADDSTLPAVRLVQITHNGAMNLPGQTVAASEDTTVLWLTGDRVRRDTGGESFMLRADSGRLLLIDHASHTYVNLGLAEAGRLLAGARAAADTAGGGKRQDRLLKGMLQVSASVRDMRETAEIDGYACRRWIAELQLGETRITTEQWVTRDIDVDFDLLRQASHVTLMGLPGAGDALSELARIDGVAVRATSIINILGRQGRSETHLAAVEPVRVPVGHFAPPRGYLPVATEEPPPLGPLGQ